MITKNLKIKALKKENKMLKVVLVLHEIHANINEHNDRLEMLNKELKGLLVNVPIGRLYSGEYPDPKEEKNEP